MKKKRNALLVKYILLVFFIFSSVYLYSQESKIKVKIIKDGAPLRLYPDSESLIIEMLPLGAIFEGEEIIGEWIKIKLPPDEEGIVIVGYIHQSIVEKHIEKVPSISPPEEGKPKVAVPAVREKPLQVYPGKKLIQIEFFGGFSFINPSDLNMRADFDKGEDEFRYNGWHNYWQSEGEIIYWEKETERDLKAVKTVLPFGFRLRFNLTSNFALSLGFSNFSKTQKSSFKFSYVAEWYDWLHSTLEVDYSPYILFVKGYIPMLGIHYSAGSNSIGFEGYITGGPLFAKCGYEIERNYNYSGEWEYWSHSTSKLKEEGKGTGIGIDAALRLNLKFNRIMGLFVEGVYSYQKISNISGPGTEDYEYNNSYGEVELESDSWEGEWGIKEVTYTYDWGSQTYQFPSNFWEDLSGDERLVRDFTLDLSGFQIRLGLFFRF